jgi:hypothetical protein
MTEIVEGKCIKKGMALACLNFGMIIIFLNKLI